MKKFLRHRFIVERLRMKPHSYEDLIKALQKSEEYCDVESFTDRTFLRDKQDIEKIYHIKIEYNNSLKAYEITEDNDLYTQNLLEAFDVFRALQNYGNLSEVVQFEKRLPAGTEYLLLLLRAIKEKRQIVVHYYKFWDKSKQPVVRTLEPLYLRVWSVFSTIVLGRGWTTSVRKLKRWCSPLKSYPPTRLLCLTLLNTSKRCLCTLRKS